MYERTACDSRVPKRRHALVVARLASQPGELMSIAALDSHAKLLRHYPIDPDVTRHHLDGCRHTW